MQQTKCRNNATITSISGRKINKQIKTHETDTTSHGAFILANVDVNL